MPGKASHAAPAPVARASSSLAHRLVALVLVLAFAVAAWRVFEVLSAGNHLVQPGDATARLWRVMSSGGSWAFLAPGPLLADWYPPGHQAFTTLIYRLDPGVNGADFAGRVQLAGVLAFLLTAALLGVAAWRAAGPLWGATAAMAALASNIALSGSVSAHSEVFGGLAAAAAIVAAGEALRRRGRAAWGAGAAAGLMLLLGTLFRHEAIVVAGVLFLWLALCRRFVAAAALLGIASLYPAARFFRDRFSGSGVLMDRYAAKYDFGSVSENASLLKHQMLHHDPAGTGLLVVLTAVCLVLTGLALHARRGGRRAGGQPVDAGSPPPTGARDAGRTSGAMLLAGLSLMAMLVWLVWSGRIDYKPRYLIQPFPLLAAGGVLAVAALSERLHPRRPHAVVAAMVVVLLAVSVSLFLTVRRFEERPLMLSFKPPARQLMEWLREHPTDRRLFDTLTSQEFRFQLYASPPTGGPDGASPDNWTYVRGTAGLKEPVGGWPVNTLESRGARPRSLAAAYLAAKAPGQVILYSDRMHRAGKGEPRGPGLHHTDSYLRPDLRNRGGGVFEFDSSVPGGPTGLRYEAAFSNKEFLVLVPVTDPPRP